MNPQLDLFRRYSCPEAVPGDACPAARDAHLLRLASQLSSRIRLGTSSWAFSGWAGVVYDRALPERVLSRTGLATYARHPLLRTVGLDRTFYAPIGEDEYRRYAGQVPAGFRFLVKAPQSLTAAYLFESREPSPHYMDPAAARDLFVAPCLAGLGAAAGPLVFQFPPQGRAMTRDPAVFATRLRRFLRGLPAGALYAVELRDRELLGPRDHARARRTAGRDSA